MAGKRLAGHEDWSPAVLPYVAVLRAFVEGRIVAQDFETIYLAIYKNDPTRWSQAAFDILESLFGDVDAYCADGSLRAEVGGLGDDELRASAVRGLERITEIRRSGTSFQDPP